MPSVSDSLSRSENIRQTSTASTETILRYPTAVIDRRVGDLVQHELTESMTLSDNHSVDDLPPADTMTPRSDSPSDLEDSGYEMVDTDVDSRDDAATESIASTDCGRSDDVASLADTEEHSDDETSADGDEDAVEGIPAYDGLDEPSETPTLHHSTNSFLGEVEKPIIRSIEFEEPADFGAENVSVKHTIADFSEERSAQIIVDMKLKTDQKHLMATIHQTMTKQGLSTKEPLRILYIGSHSAKQDIIHKIASSVTASIKGDSNIRKPSSQVYNVVPVSAFGSDETPEIELMHSSGYQIQVEDCISVNQVRDAAFPGSPSAITINTEGGCFYTSWPSKSGRPAYEINPKGCVQPHIAVIYCSDTDTDIQRRDIALARTFMNRHNIPSIVVSHRQSFNKSMPPMVLDQHAIHMCLESRDHGGSGYIIHQRLPIDLTSFLNLDARQMNRNLAYLTGLHEKARPTVQSPPELPQQESWTYSEKPRSLRQEISQKLRTITNPRGFVPVVGLLIFLGFFSMNNLSAYMRSSAVPSVSVNGSSGGQVMIPVAMPGDSSSSASSSATSTQTAVSTRTKTITVVESKQSDPNSLIPFVDFRKLTDTVNNLASSTAGPTTCSAEIIEGHKILMRIPSDIKLNWITKGDMSINLTRRGQSILVENAYSSPDGLVLELPVEEAYGLVNISVTTTRKPKINSTFHVDFGYNVQNVFDRLAYYLRTDILNTELAFRSTFSTVNDQTRAISCQIFIHLRKLQGAAEQVANHSTSATDYFASLLKATSFDIAKRSAILTRDISHRLSRTQESVICAHRLKKARSALDEALFKAQVRSKLYWLRLQGKEQEFKVYKSKVALAQKKLKMEQERVDLSKLDRKARRAGRKAMKEVRKAERRRGRA